MAISEFEHARLQKLLQTFCEEHGPPAHLRDRLRWGFRVDQEKQTVELFEIRPQFRQKGKFIEIMAVKARYVKKSKTWKVYWMPRNMKWTSYTPCPEVSTFEEFLRLVDEDDSGCFFG